VGRITDNLPLRWHTWLVPTSRRRFGVALLLDPPLSDEVNGLRRALGDPSLLRIVAHLTLVPPVNVRAEQVPAALARLRLAARSVRGPLRLTLGSASTFHPDNPVVYLEVGGEAEQLRRLRDACFAPPLERRLSWPWVPHVTLADGIEERLIPAALDALAGFSAVVEIERVTLLEEQSGRRWIPVADACLGPAAVVGTGGLSLEITQGRVPDPEVLQMLGDLEEAAPAGKSEDGPREHASFAPIVLSARREGRLMGFAAGWTDPEGGYVSVFVEPGSRRQGIGRQLLAHLEAAARRAGWPYAHLAATGFEDFYKATGGWVVATRTPQRRTAPAS
jgi:2'-5' RNA ligase